MKTTPATQLEPVELLRAAITERTEKNPSFSLRAFARASGISHTVLSLVLSGKRPLSKKAAGKLADFLELNPEERQNILGGFEKVKPIEFSSLSLDAFAVIADWSHSAIMSLLDLPNAKLEPRTVSRRLGITVLEAKLAIERLQRLDLVVQDDDGRWRGRGQALKVDNTISTPATKKFHKQLLEKAAASIDQDDVSERSMTGSSLIVDISQLEYARKRVSEFRRELIAELESKGKPNSVYFLSIQLFPAAKPDADAP